MNTWEDVHETPLSVAGLPGDSVRVFMTRADSSPQSCVVTVRVTYAGPVSDLEPASEHASRGKSCSHSTAGVEELSRSLSRCRCTSSCQ